MADSRVLRLCNGSGTVVLAGVLGLSYLPTAQSAEATQAASENDLNEIIVTADRQTAVNIQKSPIAISVVDTQALSRDGAESFDDYLKSLPSVVLRQRSPGQNQFVVRGMATQTFNHTDLQDRSLVSVYLDDTPISLQGNTPDLKIFDLDRVEVVRGPQGTLYGAGAMSGNIRFISVKPKMDKYEGSAEATLGTVKGGGTDYSVRGVFNLPLGETTALRLNAYRGRDAGYIDNIGIGKSAANSSDTTQARAVLRWAPNDTFTADLSHTYAKLRSNGEPVLWRTLQPDTTPLGQPVGTGPFVTNNTNIPEAYNDDLNLTNLTMSYAFEPAELISSSSFVHRDFDRFTSGQYLVGRRGLGLNTVPYDSIESRNNINNTLRDFAQEIRLQSRTDGKLRWITGLYYERSKRTQVQDIPTVGYDANAFGGYYYSLGYTSTSPEVGAPHADDAFYGSQTIRDRQFAVFGELTYEVLPRLKVTAGARYFDWHQDFDLYFGGLLGTSYDVNFNPQAPLVRSGVSGSETGTNPRLAISYQANDDLLLFAEGAKGFRFGGVNQPIPQTCGTQSPDTFGSDSAWTYQLGEKGTLFDKRTTLNLTAFLTKWSNVQTRKVVTECSYFFLVNDGEVKIQGLELESRSRLTDALQLSVNASYTDAKSDGPIANLGAPDGAKAPGVPKFQGSMALDYVMPAFAAGKLEFHTDVEYRDGFYDDWLVTDSAIREPSYSRLNLAVNFLSGKAWETGVYVRNVTDRQEVFNIGLRQRRSPPLFPNFQQELLGAGRTVGVRFRYNF